MIEKKLVEKLDSFIQSQTLEYLNVTDTELNFLPEPETNKKYLLYIHIPFCHVLCPYCSFNRFKFRDDKAIEYFVSLRKEMEMVKNLGYDFNSLYVGGGTTSIMEDELTKTIEHAKKLFPSIKEVSCESDPIHISSDEADQLKGLVDRFSVGIQSFDDDILKRVQRYEKFGSSKELQEKVLKANDKFPIISLDLIYNFPGQTKEIIYKDLDIATSLDVEQITTYPLMSTPISSKAIKSSIGDIDISKEREFYYDILDYFDGSAYTQNTGWHFQNQNKNNIIDEYVVDYDEYVGVGSGSFSFLRDTLYVNTFSLKEYSQKIKNNIMSVEKKRSYDETMMNKYRFMVEIFSFKRLTKKNTFLEEMFMKSFGGMEYINEKDIRLSRFGKYLTVLMMKDFYIGMDYVRGIARAGLDENGDKISK